MPLGRSRTWLRWMRGAAGWCVRAMTWGRAERPTSAPRVHSGWGCAGGSSWARRVDARWRLSARGQQPGMASMSPVSGRHSWPKPAGRCCPGRRTASTARRIAEQGLVVSEWPPGCAPMRHRFLTRNRVIAAATSGTVVVEAAARSGSLNTARSALRLDRAVMVVPGPVTSAMSVGSNALLRTEGVRAVGSVADIVEEVGRLGADLAPSVRGLTTDRDALSATVARVLDAVPVRSARGAASIAKAAGVDVNVVLGCLGPLELEGLIERAGGGYRLGPVGRPAAEARRAEAGGA